MLGGTRHLFDFLVEGGKGAGPVSFVFDLIQFGCYYVKKVLAGLTPGLKTGGEKKESVAITLELSYFQHRSFLSIITIRDDVSLMGAKSCLT